MIAFECEQCQKRLRALLGKSGSAGEVSQLRRTGVHSGPHAGRVASFGDGCPEFRRTFFRRTMFRRGNGPVPFLRDRTGRCCRRPAGPTPPEKSAPPIIIVVVLLLAAVGGFAAVKWMASPPPPVLAAIPAVNVFEFEPIEFTVRVKDPQAWQGRLSYHLVESPPGATLDEKTGAFRWTPTEEQGPSRLELRLLVKVKDRDDLWDELKIPVTVKEQNEAPTLKRIENMAVVQGETFEYQVSADDFDLPKVRLQYEFIESPEEARIDPATGMISWNTGSQQCEGGRRFEAKSPRQWPAG